MKKEPSKNNPPKSGATKPEQTSTSQQDIQQGSAAAISSTPEHQAQPEEKDSQPALDRHAKDHAYHTYIHTGNAPYPDSQDNINRFESNKKYFTISIYAIFVIAIGTIIVYTILNIDQTKAALSNLVGILSPFIGAFFIAYLLNPMVKKIRQFLNSRLFHSKRLFLSNVLSILISYICVIGLIALTIGYVSPQLVKSLKDLTDSLPAMYDAISKYLNNLDAYFPNLDLAFIEERIRDLLPDLISYGTNLATNLVPMLYTLSVSIVRGFINVLLAIVISCYMLSDKTKLALNAKRIVFAILPRDKAESFCETASKCNHIFSAFIVGKSIDSLIIGILCFILMSILRLPYSVLISVIVGVTNMIPYFGPFIGAVPGILICLFINPIQALIFAAMILALQQFDGLFLGPKILGDSTGLTPLWVIFAITIGGAYAGVLGMFLGVPITAVIAFILNKAINSRLLKKNIDPDSEAFANKPE